MKIGDKLRLTPTFYSKAGLDEVKEQDCTVVFIHPQEIFFVVEFHDTECGRRWRETFYFPERAGKYIEK